MPCPSWFKKSITSPFGQDVSNSLAWNEKLWPIYEPLTDDEKRVLRLVMIVILLAEMPEQEVDADQFSIETLDLVFLVKVWREELRKTEPPPVDFDKELETFNQLTASAEAT
jgi:hypothetical protein